MTIPRGLRLLTTLALPLAIGCSDGGSSGGGAAGGTGGAATGGAAGTGGTAGTGGAGATGGNGSCDSNSCDAPPEAAALFSFLKAGSYQTWNKESAAHASTGPHSASVRAWVSPTLDKSLTDGATSHPVGAAAVKEFLDSGGAATGWAVWVKVQSDSAAGQGFYWYETFDASTGSAAADGVGVSLCVNCHEQPSGKDYFLSPVPLQ
ncbi:MAG TPA: hypothetical protein PKD61_03790 [Polyangiaceae bacterium]|nr:hypothetical protein [Polyangiaceae bacterium]